MDNQSLNQNSQVNLTNQPSIISAKQPAENFKYAGFIIRYVALTFDWELLIFIILFILNSFPFLAKNYQNIIGFNRFSITINSTDGSG